MQSCIMHAMEWQDTPKKLAPLVKATFRCKENQELFVYGTQVDELIKLSGTLNGQRNDFETDDKSQSFIFETSDFDTQEIENLFNALRIISKGTDNAVSAIQEIENNFSLEQLIQTLNHLNIFDVNQTELFEIELLSKVEKLWQEKPEANDYLDKLCKDVFKTIKNRSFGKILKNVGLSNCAVKVHPCKKLLVLYRDNENSCKIYDDQNKNSDAEFKCKFKRIKWHPTENRLILLYKNKSISEFNLQAGNEIKKTDFENTLDENIHLSVHPTLPELLAIWYPSNRPGYIHWFNDQKSQWQSTMGTRLKFHPQEPIIAYENIEDIVIENIQTGNVLNKFDKHVGVVTKLCWNKKENKQLAYGTIRGEIGILDYSKNEALIKAEIGHCVNNLKWNEEGNLLAGHSLEAQIAILDVLSKKQSTIKTDSVVDQIVWCNNKELMVLAGNALFMMDTMTGKNEKLYVLSLENYNKIARYGDSIIGINTNRGTQGHLYPNIRTFVQNSQELKLCYLIENDKLSPAQKKQYKKVYQGMDPKLKNVLQEYYDVRELSTDDKIELEN